MQYVKSEQKFVQSQSIKSVKKIPSVTKKRLAVLANYLAQILAEEEVPPRIKSAKLATFLGCTETTVRHDLWLVGYSGGVSNGYDVFSLYHAVCDALGVLHTADCVADTGTKIKKRSEIKCCIVGLGKIGATFLDEELFDSSNFRVVAGFDKNVNRTEILRSTFPLYPAARLESVVSAEKIKYALLCVSDSEAVKMALRLAACGIRGIVNYTNMALPAIEGVNIIDASPVLTLFAMDCETV